MLKNTLLQIVTVVFLLILYPLNGYSKVHWEILSQDICLNKSTLKQYVDNIFQKYEELVKSMSTGDNHSIQQKSTEFMHYLQSIEVEEVQKVIAPSLSYLKAMSLAKSYKEQRELFSFMVAPLLSFIPSSCLHEEKECMECKQNRKRYASLLTRVPSLNVPAKDMLLLEKAIQEYQTIHRALYVINKKEIAHASKALYTVMEQMNFLPLKPYIDNVLENTKLFISKKKLEEQVTAFYLLTQSINAILRVIY